MRKFGLLLYALTLYLALLAPGVADAAIQPTTVAQNFTTVALAVAGAIGGGLIAGGLVVGAVGSLFGAAKWAERGWGAMWWGAACGLVAVIGAFLKGGLGALFGRTS